MAKSTTNTESTKPKKAAPKPLAVAAAPAPTPATAESKAPKSAPKAKAKPAEKPAAETKASTPTKRTKSPVAPTIEPTPVVNPGTGLPDQTEIDRMIAETAYYIAERRNFAPGSSEEDWQLATAEVMARLKGD